VSVALLNGIIYAMGGFDGHHRLGSAEKYNFERNQWTMIAPMTSQRSDACAAVMNGKYYVPSMKNLSSSHVVGSCIFFKYTYFIANIILKGIKS